MKLIKKQELQRLLVRDDAVRGLVALIQQHLTLYGTGERMVLATMPPTELVHEAAKQIAKSRNLTIYAQYGPGYETRPHLAFSPVLQPAFPS